MRGRIWGLGVGALLGASVACHSPGDLAPASAMLPDGKEAIYSFLSQGTVAAADDALKNVWDVSPRNPPVAAWPITWTEDPYDKYWCVLFYSLRFTSPLLYAYYTTGDPAYRDKLLDVVRSYDAYEVQRGSAPSALLDDPHTAAFRAMVLVNIYGKLSRTNDLPGDVAAGMRASIEKTGAFLALDENFQDGQNHGFNQAAALLAVAVNFADLPEAATWQALALSRLAMLMQDTVDADGVEIEDSPFYHFYVLSAVAQDSRWMHAYGVPLPPGFDAKMGLMLDYATYMPQPDGLIPLLGASVKLQVRKLLPGVYDEASIDALEGFAETSPAFDWIRSGGTSGTQPTERSKRFPVSGQSFLRSSFGPKLFNDQTYLSFNVGAVRSAHCHLDALAVTYASNNVTLLADSGLYQYDSPPTPIADYFHGTRAHNAVVVDGADQRSDAASVSAVYPGLATSGDTWAYQSGSHKLYAGVTHARGVLLLQKDLALILDDLESADPHAYTQTWHLAPGETIAVSGLDVTASDATGKPNLALHQAIADGVTLSAIIGQDSPVIQGYYSSDYGTKSANYALEYAASASTRDFATLIASGSFATAPATLDVAATPGAGSAGASFDARICVGGRAFHVVVSQLAAGGETISVQESSACPGP